MNRTTLKRIWPNTAALIAFPSLTPLVGFSGGLALGDLQAADEGAYRVEVWNRVGAIASPQATVPLVPPGGLGVFRSSPPFGQQLEVSVAGDAGGSVRPEKSANLREWSLLADTNAFAGTWSGMVNLGDANPTQFFRAIRY